MNTHSSVAAMLATWDAGGRAIMVSRHWPQAPAGQQ